MIRIYLAKWQIDGDKTKNDIVDIFTTTQLPPGITASYHYPSTHPRGPNYNCLVIMQFPKGVDLSMFDRLANTQLLPITSFYSDYSKFSSRKLKKFNSILAKAGYKRKVKNIDTEGEVLERLMQWLEPLSAPLRKEIREDAG